MTPRNLSQLLLLILGIHIIGCNLHNSGKVQQDRAPIWKYYTSQGEFEEIPNADCLADNYLNLKHLNLTVRPLLAISKNNRKSQVTISVVRGQFIRSAVGTTIKVKFDDCKPELYTVIISTDGGGKPTDEAATILYIENADRFISWLKKAKYVTIESEIKDNGNQVIKFYAAGLKW